jgi:NAD+ kinase
MSVAESQKYFSNYVLIEPMSHTKATSHFQTVAIIGKHGASGIHETLLELADFLQSIGRTVIVESDTAKELKDSRLTSFDLEEICRRADLAIVVGGDGTMLGIARQLASFKVPLIGVNLGRLGFMTDIPKERMLPLLQDIFEGQLASEKRSLLEGVILRGEQTIFKALAFNDIVVSRTAAAGMVELRVEVDGHFMYNQRSDGLILSTPTGSTAYALSAGGPILHPELDGIVLVPIAPHSLSNRPIVLSGSCEIVIRLASGYEGSVNFDMQSITNLQQHDKVIVRRSEHAITFLHPVGWSYYDTLREKLHWNEYPSVLGQLK